MGLADYRLKFSNRSVYPIVQGGMGVNISNSNLALEIVRLGGVGTVSDAMSPSLSDRILGTKHQQQKLKKYRSFLKNDDKCGVHWDEEVVYQANRDYATHVMSLKCGSGLLFMNVMEKLTMGAPLETLRARICGALDGGIDGITLSAGLHTGSLKLIEDHPRFRDAIFGIIVSSVRALKIFLRSASRVNRLPDFIVVEGPLAGGHLGFGLDWANYNLADITKEVLDFIKEEALSIPIISAGGIFTGSDAESYLRMGASAVQVATRFTITKECGMPENVKREYLKAKEEDIIVNLTSPTGYPMRMLSYSPSLKSSIRPNCEALGYMLDKEGKCQYREAYNSTGSDSSGVKFPVTDKMCICFHFMNYSCYTCGQNVFRLKDTLKKDDSGQYLLPSAQEVFLDYLNS